MYLASGIQITGRPNDIKKMLTLFCDQQVTKGLISLTGCVLKISEYRTCPQIPLLSYADHHWCTVWHFNQSSVSGKGYSCRGGSQACEPSQVVDCMNRMYVFS